MWYELELDFSVDERCRFYLDWEYYDDDEWDPSILTKEEREKTRVLDKAQFLSEFHADYRWGPHAWNQPEFDAQQLIWLLEKSDMLDGRKRPKDNRELEALLREAVSAERIIVEIVPDGDGGIYVPLSNPASDAAHSEGILASVESFAPLQSAVSRNGEPILSGPYDPSTQEARLNAARGLLPWVASASDDADSDLFGIVKVAAGAVPGSGIDSATDVGDDATPLGDALPFEYGGNVTGDNVFVISARGVSAEDEAECFAQYEQDMMACDMVGAMYRDSRTYLLCKQRAFSNYQTCRGF
jgi:hypothetical protein